ncbi:flagellar motor protein MotA [Hyphococcus sp.]|uniref:flagellar motor protein MotA n=1 Tax=Hyphococcus sp. TaxID=2038636 RepID=UPI003CCBFF2C
MARSLERSVKFVRPGPYILNMLLFLIGVGAIIYYLSPLSPQPSPLLIDAFNANPALNGLILGVLAIGVIYNLRQAGVIAPAVRWVEAFRESVDPGRSRLPRAPTLIRAMATMLLDADRTNARKLNPDSSRAILDSIGTRMDEGREMGRYLMNLLVFLGLLGTFWGLLETVNAVADTINGLANTGGAAEDAVSQLIANLREPLSGMGTAFSSSLFGLGGSLVVGFLDLQAGQAQNRFYTDLEDWLAGMTDTARISSKGGANLTADIADGDLICAIQALEAALAANTETQIKAQAGQTAELKDEIRALNRTLIRVGGGE